MKTTGDESGGGYNSGNIPVKEKTGRVLSRVEHNQKRWHDRTPLKILI